MRRKTSTETELSVTEHLPELRLRSNYMMIIQGETADYELTAKDWNEVLRLAELGRSCATVDMLLVCPRCQRQHVDAPLGDWTNPPHATHTCQHCGLLWRPSNDNTNGVLSLPVLEEKHAERMRAAKPNTFQQRCRTWLQETLGARAAEDTQERAFRFLEEALELGQSLGVTPEQACRLLEYVYERPAGVPAQEVGGVMCTLAVLGASMYLDVQECAEHELARCSLPEVRERIRQKQAAKPHGSPLPGDAP